MKPSDLKFTASEISETGRTINGELPSDWLGETLLTAYTALSGVKVKLEARGMGDSVFVSGEARFDAAYKCSRTFADGRTEIVAPFGELFVTAPRYSATTMDDDEVEAVMGSESWAIEGGVVDADSLIREALVLAQDPYPVVDGPDASAAPAAEAGQPAWSSNKGDIDPRWAALKNFDLKGSK